MPVVQKNLDFAPFFNFKTPAKREGGKLTVLGRNYDLWLSRPIPGNGKPKPWQSSADARGRRYVNTEVELPQPERRNAPCLGIDLGLRSLVALAKRIQDRSAKILPPRGETTRRRDVA
jgi:transposase